jgi:peptidoglycan hydrolase-like protein with peptidoglycan-binding domain
MVNTVNLTKPSLRFGDSGPAVKELQTLLDGYSQFIKAPAISPGAIDEIFGATTQNAVMAFQEQVFLPRTGIVADLTWRSLFKRAPVRRVIL